MAGRKRVRDYEVDVIQDIVCTLNPLPADSRVRIVEYLGGRYLEEISREPDPSLIGKTNHLDRLIEIARSDQTNSGGVFPTARRGLSLVSSSS